MNCFDQKDTYVLPMQKRYILSLKKENKKNSTS